MRNIIAFVLFSFILVACGGESTSDAQEVSTQKAEKVAEEAPKAQPTAPKVSEAKADDSFDVEVSLSGNDAMRYDKEEIKVKAGQRVKLNFSHTGKLPKEAMGHNFVLLNKSAVVALIATKAAKAKDNDYIPEEHAKDIIAHTKMIGGGESTSIVFDAPAAGTYNFICTFPGHYGLMKGEFIVE